MTKDKQILAIATYLGWTDIQRNCFESVSGFIGKNSNPIFRLRAIGYQGYAANGTHRSDWGYEIQNYLEDLNAMHKAEITLSLELRDIYRQYLNEITQVSRMASIAWTTLNATAAQRAEALLKTLKLWTKE